MSNLPAGYAGSDMQRLTEKLATGAAAILARVKPDDKITAEQIDIAICLADILLLLTDDVQDAIATVLYDFKGIVDDLDRPKKMAWAEHWRRSRADQGKK